MLKRTLTTAGVLGASGVILGALGAHALKPLLSIQQLESYEIAVRFQMYHALAILILGLIINFRQSKLLKYAFVSFLTGTILFSGSIYLLSLKGLLDMPFLRILGPVTPFGGIFLIAGWIFIALEGFKKTKDIR